jgi:shikimate kinase
VNTLLILNGIPGSGKTSLGKLLSQRNGFNIVKVDTFYETIPRVDDKVQWLEDIKYRENVYIAFENKIKEEIIKSNVIIESTGIGEQFRELVDRLKKNNIKIVRVLLNINEQTARERVSIRNNSDYTIKVSDDDMDYFTSNINKFNLNEFIVLDANQSLEYLYSQLCKTLPL